MSIFLLSGKFLDYLSRQFKKAYSGSMGDTVRAALEPSPVNFFGLEVNPSVYTAIGVTIVLLIALVLIRIFVIPKFKKIPSGFQLVLEKFVGYFQKSSSTYGTTIDHSDIVAPFTLTAATFIAVGTLVEFFGIRPAFADINACAAFGLSAFFVINICGFRQKGLLGRSKRFLNPINIISDISVPLSLSLRLFGSIMSGFIIMDLVYSIVFTSFVLPVIVSVVTTVFHAAIQSYLYTTLTNVYVSEAVE